VVKLAVEPGQPEYAQALGLAVPQKTPGGGTSGAPAAPRAPAPAASRPAPATGKPAWAQ
jgi:hypothetical protein